MKQNHPFYPIIYVRGFAATMGEIEDTVATPYMGFNLGATKVRQDYTGKPVKFIFESPLIRLMKDFGYVETCHHGEEVDANHLKGLRNASEREKFARSIWIFRYYEDVSEDLGDGRRRGIPEFAKMLRDYIHKVRDLLCDTDQEKRDFKVYLVAHSMGGLICRCYLQNICRDSAVTSHVDKVFTYATPHNGIDMLNINAPGFGFGMDTNNFNRKEMRNYFKIRDNTTDANSLDGTFDPGRFFSFIGTNYKDYGAFFGLSKRGTGSMSDGLVMMKHAYVQESPRAFAHRSHSGHFGIVNSEEGYQNLTRFLFGQVKVVVSLATSDITFPKAVWDKIKTDSGTVDYGRVKASYYVESSAAIRNEKYFINERRLHQESAIQCTYDRMRAKPLYLFTGFLHGREGETQRTIDGLLSFAIEVAVKTPIYEIDRRFWFDGHYEGKDILNETVVISVSEGPSGKVYYQTRDMSQRKVLEPDPQQPGRFKIPLHPRGKPLDTPEARKPAESFWGELLLDLATWNKL